MSAVTLPEADVGGPSGHEAEKESRPEIGWRHLGESSGLAGLRIGRGRAHTKCSAPSGGGQLEKNQGPRCPPPRLLGPLCSASLGNRRMSICRGAHCTHGGAYTMAPRWHRDGTNVACPNTNEVAPASRRLIPRAGRPLDSRQDAGATNLAFFRKLLKPAP
jgi:hypothetical protein